MIFPSMTLVKVIAAQIVGLLAIGNAGAGRDSDALERGPGESL